MGGKGRGRGQIVYWKSGISSRSDIYGAVVGPPRLLNYFILRF